MLAGLRARPAAPLALAVLATVALAGCAKDLEVPALRTAPVLTSLSPDRAWAGQLVRIEGTRLEGDPAANVVTFAGATARGLRFEGATLVVRVPDDAGSGPVIVTNGQGTSDPFGPFAYLGLGEPRRRAVATSRPILHRPTAVHSLGGEVFLHSALYGGLLAAGDPAFVTGAARLSAAAPWHGSLYYTSRDSQSRVSRLTQVDAAGAIRAEVVLPFEPSQLLVMRGVDLVVAFGTDAANAESLVAWNLDLTDASVDVTTVGIDAFFGAADVGDGRAAVVAYDGNLGGMALELVDVGAARTGALPAPVPVPGSPASFGLNASNLVPIAVALASPASPRAVLPLESGDLAVADLGPSPAFVGTVATFSRTTFEALAGAETVPVVLATRPADDLSVGVDVRDLALLWSVPGDAPTAASAVGDDAFVGHRGSNDVSVVSLASGSRVARVSFDVAPGGSGTAYGGTTALLSGGAAPAWSEDELFFPASAFPALLRFPLGESDATVVSRAAAVELVAAASTTAALWAASGTGDLEAFQGRAWGAPVTVAGGGPPRFLAVQGTRLAVAYEGWTPPGPALQVVDGATTLAWGPLPGATELHGMGFLPDGRIWISLAQGADGEHVQLWDPAHVASPGTPDVDGVLGRLSVSAPVLLEDGLWIIAEDAGGEALLLDPDLAVARTIALAAAISAVHAVSPNGRVLVQRVLGGTPGETLLRFFRADPDAGFPQLDQVVVPGNVEGLAFDETGERLWVVTRAPDRVVLVD